MSLWVCEFVRFVRFWVYESVRCLSCQFISLWIYGLVSLCHYSKCNTVLPSTDRAELIYSHLCLISPVREECLFWFCFKKAINSSPFAEILKVKSISLFFFVFACKFKENKLYLQKYLIIKIDHYEPDINSHKAARIVAPFVFCNRDFNFDEPNLLRSNNKCSDP